MFGSCCLVFACLIVCLLAAIIHRRPITVFAHTDERAQGAELYKERGCTHCHGVNGEGSESGPSLRGVRRRLTAAQIERQVTQGGQQMPAFGDTLDHEQVQSLVAFLRAKTSFPESPGKVPLR